MGNRRAWVGAVLVGSLAACVVPPPETIPVVVDVEGVATLVPGGDEAILPIRIRPGGNITPDLTSYGFQFINTTPSPGGDGITATFEGRPTEWGGRLHLRASAGALRGNAFQHAVTLRSANPPRPLEIHSGRVVVEVTGADFRLSATPLPATVARAGMAVVEVAIQREAGSAADVTWDAPRVEDPDATQPVLAPSQWFSAEVADATPAAEKVHVLLKELGGTDREVHVTLEAASATTRQRLVVPVFVTRTAPAPSLIEVTPNSVVLEPGGTTTAQVRMTAERQPQRCVLAADGVPAGLGVTFAPDVLDPDGGVREATVTITAQPDAGAGVHVIELGAFTSNLTRAVGVAVLAVTVRGQLPDAGPEPEPDGGEPSSDAGPDDAGLAGAGALDAGGQDAGAPDAGQPDAGVVDAGPGDAGPPDAGMPDAGPGLILTFTASPMGGDAGADVTFTWTTDNADGCSLDPSSYSILSANSSLTFPVQATTTFTLFCWRGALSETRSLTVTMNPPPVSIITFEVAPSPLSRGDEAWVSWTVKDATACTVTPGNLDAGPPSGSFSVVPLTDTTFTLTCAGRDGPVTATSSIVVVPNTPPNATILAPDAGLTFEMGDAITLSGTCTDDLAGGTALYPSWSTVPGLVWVGSELTVVTRAFNTPGPQGVEFQCYDALLKSDPTPPQVGFTVVVPTVASASVAVSHGCLRTVSGKLYCAGDNRQGLLGQGSTSTIGVLRPVRVGIRTDWVEVGTSTTSTLARAADGTLWFWGMGLPTPAQVGTATNWTHLAAGSGHRCAINAAGQLFCWGGNYKSQLGVANGSSTDPTRVGTNSDWLQIAVGTDATCGLRAGGTAWCWGRPLGSPISTAGSLAPVQTGATITWASLSMGSESACGLDTLGALYCWGNDGYGQLGDGTPGVSSLTPVRVGTASDWVEVSVGASHACARRVDGTLWCWGNDAAGQLGNGAAGTTATPTQVGTATDWVSVNAGGSSGNGTCGVRAGGQAYCWGLGDWGQLGIGAYQAAVQVPTPISFAP